jgi:hypothetical protein
MPKAGIFRPLLFFRRANIISQSIQRGHVSHHQALLQNTTSQDQQLFGCKEIPLV